MTWGYMEQRRQYYNQGFHTFGLEWNDQYLWTCASTHHVDTAARLRVEWVGLG